ncbi:phosphatidate cytidylyltransferase [bacterium DOLJORAL78_65_58]|nr:MAG: phosphatidate cytidylyltransferase [bacterium DOLZORAL124_64_63]PIE75969.1 MAG: phosphatidate cytidylyltransferase [bacterium DOLJORAL78_65_58]
MKAGDANPGAWGRFLRAGIMPRVLVILLGVPCLYLIAARGGIFFLLLVNLVIFLGLREFYVLMRHKGYRPYGLLGHFCALSIGVYAWHQGVVVPLIMTGSLLAIMIREVFRSDMDQSLNHMAVTVFGIMYVGWLGSHLMLLRQLPVSLGVEREVGARLVFLVALLTWSTDTAAYLFGVAFGRHKLIPRVSPKKSVEGAVGGLVGAGVMGWYLTGNLTPFMTPVAGAVLGLVVGIMAQLGDLAESLIKRDAGIKDSAELIPGHGGVLDRFDSLLFTAPVVYYYFRFFHI